MLDLQLDVWQNCVWSLLSNTSNQLDYDWNYFSELKDSYSQLPKALKFLRMDYQHERFTELRSNHISDFIESCNFIFLWILHLIAEILTQLEYEDTYRHQIENMEREVRQRFGAFIKYL